MDVNKSHWPKKGQTYYAKQGPMGEWYYQQRAPQEWESCLNEPFPKAKPETPIREPVHFTITEAHPYHGYSRHTRVDNCPLCRNLATSYPVELSQKLTMRMRFCIEEKGIPHFALSASLDFEFDDKSPRRGWYATGTDHLSGVRRTVFGQTYVDAGIQFLIDCVMRNPDTVVPDRES